MRVSLALWGTLCLWVVTANAQGFIAPPNAGLHNAPFRNAHRRQLNLQQYNQQNFVQAGVELPIPHRQQQQAQHTHLHHQAPQQHRFGQFPQHQQQQQQPLAPTQQQPHGNQQFNGPPKASCKRLLNSLSSSINNNRRSSSCPRLPAIWICIIRTSWTWRNYAGSQQQQHPNQQQQQQQQLPPTPQAICFGSFGSSNGFPQWPAHWPSFNLPPGVTPRTTTKTETDDQGRTVTSVSSFYSGPLNPGTNLFESQFPNSAAPRPAVPASLPVLPHQHFAGQAPPPNPNRPSLGFPLPAMPSPRSTTPLPALAPSFGLDMLTTTPLPPLDDFLQQRTTPRIDGNTDESIPPPLPTRRPTANAPQEGDKSIEDYLSKVNLSPSDILAQNGEVVKTIVDKDGRVLSARFVLSTVREEEQIRQEPQPTK
ncbi:GL21057 [Drosophila persimilis]|uniref:GL21057 n=1 Tax=Drosophila persimilis TaxID=7234 RepID=B4GX58_DROPE|nr:GL21057 [Drosophila persimilis]